MYKIEIYKWLLNLLKDHPRGLTFNGIRNRYFSIGSIEELEKRTFHRYKKELKDLFGINIECTREGDNYVYRARGLENVDVDMLLLGNVVIPSKADDNSSIIIQVDGNAVGWMRNLLKYKKYEEIALEDGSILVEFEAPITEMLARSLLPYSDCIEVESPEDLTLKIYELLKASVDRINKCL